MLQCKHPKNLDDTATLCHQNVHFKKQWGGIIKVPRFGISLFRMIQVRRNQVSQLKLEGRQLQHLAINESRTKSVRTGSPTRDVMAVSLLPGTSPPASIFNQQGCGAQTSLTFFRLRVGDLQVAVGSFQLLSPHNLLL